MNERAKGEGAVEEMIDFVRQCEAVENLGGSYQLKGGNSKIAWTYLGLLGKGGTTQMKRS